MMKQKNKLRYYLLVTGSENMSKGYEKQDNDFTWLIGCCCHVTCYFSLIGRTMLLMSENEPFIL
jgi:hypothetical protein